MSPLSTIWGSSTLARYFGRRFLVNLAAVFFGCLALIFIIDSVENLRRAGSHDVGLATVMLLSLYRLPSLSELVLPFAVLFAAMMTFLLLTRSLELVVARSAGVSAWQFIAPILFIAFAIGIAATTLYNPIAAKLAALHETLHADSFGADATPLGGSARQVWLRQRGVDGPSIMHAKQSTGRGLLLREVTVLTFDDTHRFSERIQAQAAHLEDGHWRLSNAWVVAPSRDAAFHGTYLLDTYLTPTQVRDSLDTAETVSFWQLPRYIETAEQADLPAIQHRLQYQTLLARPLLLAAMVLIAATVSLRVFRFGNVSRLILGGIIAGFMLYVVSNLAIDLGKTGVVPPVVAAWAPAIVVTLLGMTVLLFQEDG